MAYWGLPVGWQTSFNACMRIEILSQRRVIMRMCEVRLKFCLSTNLQTSLYAALILVRFGKKHVVNRVGVVDRRDQHKPTICSQCCLIPSQTKPFYSVFDSLDAHSGAYIFRSGRFRVDNDRRTNRLLFFLCIILQNALDTCVSAWHYINYMYPDTVE